MTGTPKDQLRVIHKPCGHGRGGGKPIMHVST